MLILGISAYYHDSAAVLLSGEKIIAAAQQERFSRFKHDAAFPADAIRFVLNAAAVRLTDLDYIVFYDKPLLKFERLLETYYAYTPFGLRSFLTAMPVWVKEKLFMRKMLRDALTQIHGRPFKRQPRMLFPEHHLSHAASAYYPSPFDKAAILTIDGVGEWATTTIGYGCGREIEILKEIRFPHSLGLLYSAFTAWRGFKVNDGEYKLMGLAPYGDPHSDRTQRYYSAIREQLIDIRKDGSFVLNMDYFDFATGSRMCNAKLWQRLFRLPERQPESRLDQGYMDLALAIQQVTELIVLRLAETAHALTDCLNLVMAGGAALNCVANGKLLKRSVFIRLWIQPASGDAGGALGAAYAALHIHAGVKRTVESDGQDRMQGAYLGPSFSHRDVCA